MFYRHYNSTRFDYYNNFLFPKEVDTLCEIRKNAEHGLRTHSAIRFKNLHFGADRQSVLRMLKKPRFEIVRDLKQHNYLVLFYKEKIKDIKLLTQLHLINDRFFFGCYTFRNLEYTRFSLVKSALLEKYKSYKRNGEDIPGRQEGNFQNIIDNNNNNTICCIDDVLLRICYLCGDKTLLKLLTGYASERDEQSASQKNPLQASLLNIL